MIDLDLHIDRGERKFTFVSTQDVEPIIERNKQLQTIDQSGDWGRHIGTIPNVILMQWYNEEYERGNVTLRMYTDEFDRIIERKLKDPEWAFLRTDRPRLVMGFGS